MTNMKLSLAAAALCLTACKPAFDLNFEYDGTGATPGESGALEAAFSEGCGAFLSSNNCAIDGPILSGATAAITLYSVGHPDTPLKSITVESSDRTVLGVASQHTDADGNPQIYITGVAPGQGSISVYDSNHEFLDAFELHVGLPYTLSSQPSLAIFQEALVSVPVTAQDEDGHQMFGRGGISFDTGALTHHDSYDRIADRDFNGTDHTVVSGDASETVVVVASYGQLRTSTVVEVDDASEVTAIHGEATVSAGNDGAAQALFWAANAKKQQVIGAVCDLSIEEAQNVAITVTPPPIAQSIIDLEGVQLTSKLAQCLELTCSIGTAQFTTQVTFP